MPQIATVPSPPAQRPSATASATQPSALAPVVATEAPATGSPVAVYQAMRAQRSELRDQLERLVDTRQDLVRELAQPPSSDVARAGLEQRLAQVDQQIAAVAINIGEADRLVAQAAAVPGATVEPPRPNPWLYGPPEEIVAMSIGLTALLLFPVMLAWARRIWRRSSAAVVPAEVTDRLGAMERSLDAVAIEIERIGEGQRFVSQLLAGRAAGAAEARAVGAPAAAANPPSAP